MECMMLYAVSGTYLVFIVLVISLPNFLLFLFIIVKTIKCEDIMQGAVLKLGNLLVITLILIRPLFSWAISRDWNNLPFCTGP